MLNEWYRDDSVSYEAENDTVKIWGIIKETQQDTYLHVLGQVIICVGTVVRGVIQTPPET